jgi:hypothetical protein
MFNIEVRNIDSNRPINKKGKKPLVTPIEKIAEENGFSLMKDAYPLDRGKNFDKYA